MKKAKIFVFTLLATCYMLNASYARADNYESERYRIQCGAVNIGGENSLMSGGYNLSVSLGQNAAGEFQSSGYVVKAGFQYLHSIIPFRFTISNTNMNFGTILPQVPATQQTVLTISSGGAGGYQVTAQEATPLKTLAAVTIPDTVCNEGSTKETAENIMTNENVGKNRQATVTFKVNISPIQAAGSYQTIVKFIATPGY